LQEPKYFDQGSLEVVKKLAALRFGIEYRCLCRCTCVVENNNEVRYLIMQGAHERGRVTP
jgi:hypothetical protein